MAEDDSPHLHLPAFSSAVASASGSDDAGSPDDTVIESISDDGMGVENGGSSSSSSSSSILRLSVATDVACSGVGDGVGGDIVPLAVLPPPSIEEQVSLVRVVLENSDEIKPGQTRFLVAKRWLRRWEDYVGWNSFDWSSPGQAVFREPPGPITNREILEDDGKTLRENQDLEVEDVDGRLWELLSGWFGGNPIPRLVVMDNGRPKVELYQLNLKLTRKGGGSLETTISKSCTVGDLRREGIAALQIGSPEECEGLRLHVMTSRRFTLRELDDDEETLGHIFSLNDAWVQFELPGDVDDSGDDSSSSYSWGGSSYFSRPSATPGVVGLQNLGNTCFMNAAVQCLSHIPQVVEFFGGGKNGQPHFLQDLNTDNPLGTKGELARAFGDLVRRMWEGKERCVYPREFRSVLCDHAQQFLGYEQHDSQEFLAYLLDGIHEDVNRVREKPFVEKVEANADESDEMAADRSWQAHLQRNDSFIVDTMHGQYKSVVTCPVEGCKKTSTTFDPAMYLSLPLPVTAEKSVEVVLVTPDGRRPKRYVVWVSKTATVKDLRRSLAQATGKREDRLAFAQVWLYKFHDVFEDDRSLSNIRLDELFAFELFEWPEPQPLPPAPAHDDEYGLRDTASGGWEQKLAPFLMITFREKELQAASDADGRWRLYRDTKRYLARFPSAQEVAELTSKQEVDQDDSGFSEADFELKHRLTQASADSYPFVELSSLEKLAGFSDAVQSLKALVLHEQRDVTVQIIQHRSTAYTYGRTSTTFSFPLLVSYLPLSTTIGEFRNMLAVVLRRLVLPRDAARKDEGMDLESAADESEYGEALNSPSKRGEYGADGSDTTAVVDLFRSGGLELLTEDYTGREVNILGGRDCRDEDLVSDSIDEPASCMSTLKLRWSEDAFREAYDSSEVNMIEDDSSVALSRNRLPKTLSVGECVDCFLEREQLDDTEMWYCSSCKEHRRAFKLLELWRLPPVLVIHLKRFSYDTYGGWAASREKIEDFITFPVRGLNMQHLERVPPARAADVPKEEFPSPASSGTTAPDADQHHQEEQALKAAASAFTTHPGRQEEQQQTTTSSAPAVYDLWGVVNHYGGLGGGHYTAFALNMTDNMWYEFSDDRVSVVDSEADLVTSAAYVLFYSRRTACSNKRSEDGVSEDARDSSRNCV